MSPVQGETESVLTSNISLHLWPLKAHLPEGRKVGFVISLSSKTCLWGREPAVWPCVKHPVFVQSSILQIIILNETGFRHQLTALLLTRPFLASLGLYKCTWIDWRISLWIGKAKRKKEEKKIHFPLLLAFFVIWAANFFHQAGCRSVFSEDEVDIGTYTHTLTKHQSIASCQLQWARSSCRFWRRFGTVLSSPH